MAFALPTPYAPYNRSLACPSVVGPRRRRVAPPFSVRRDGRTLSDLALVKALARAFRWKRMLEHGRYGSISELSVAEKLDRGYLGRIVALTLLAPDIVGAILDGRQAPEMTLPVLMKAFPGEWAKQRAGHAASLIK